VHQEITVDLVFQLRDRVGQVPVDQGRVPLEISRQDVGPDVLGIALTMSAHLPDWLGQ
jgi:hypothetical protein